MCFIFVLDHVHQVSWFGDSVWTGRFRDQIPVAESFLSRPERSQGPTILQYKECRVFSRGKNGQGLLKHNPPPPSAEVANRVGAVPSVSLCVRLGMSWVDLCSPFFITSLSVFPVPCLRSSSHKRAVTMQSETHPWKELLPSLFSLLIISLISKHLDIQTAVYVNKYFKKQTAHPPKNEHKKIKLLLE